MPTKRPTTSAVRTLPPKRAIEILTDLLKETAGLENEPFGSPRRDQWTTTAQGALDRAFEPDSSILTSFSAAQSIVFKSGDSAENLRRADNHKLAQEVAVIRSAIQQLNWAVEAEEDESISWGLNTAKAVPVAPDPATPPPSKKHSWLPNHWMIERNLGEGGQGWTYLVRRSAEPGGELYVFKRLKNQDRTGRLEAEIKALMTLPHPGILKIVDHGKANDSPYYVAEYCGNGDLGKWKPSAASLLKKLTLFREICDAIAAAHKANIIHRDIKPSNVLIRVDDSVAIGDFGLCLHLMDADDRLTATSEAVGARNYMAPELEDGRADDPRPAGDVYSLGKLLYFILSGRSLSREKHRSEPHNLLLSEAAGIDPGLYFVYDLLDRTIVASPENRYENAAELRDALDRVIMKIEKNANVLDMKVRQHCVYCISGDYRPMEGSGDQHTLRLVCSNCGNIQHFTTQYAGARNWWMTR